MGVGAGGKGLPPLAYRKSHDIDGTTEGEQTDYQKRIVVHRETGVDSDEDVYVGTKCRTDFGDIRFTKNLSELDYWIEETYLDPSLGRKIVDNDGLSVAAIQGNIIGPQAIHYVGTHNRTYAVYMDSGYDPKILYFDHATESWSSPVKVATSPIDDSHAAPALLIDQNGYLHVFYGCHNTAVKHAKSDNVEDISAWTVQANVAADASYPSVRLASNGDIYLFYRKAISSSHRVECFVKSTDNGGSWSAPATVVDFGDNYWIYHAQMVLGSDDSIHLTWSYRSYAPLIRYNVYYAYSTDGGSTWYAKDGTDLGATISKAEADANCLVYDSTGDPAVAADGEYITGHAHDLRLDASNEPFIAFVHGKAGSEWQIGFAKWNAGTVSWDTFNITTSAIPYGRAILDYVSSTDVKAYCLVDSVAGRSIELWESGDNGETWSKTSTLTDLLYASNATLVNNYLSDLVVLWAQREAAGNTDIYAYGDKMTPEAYGIFWVEVDSIPADPDSATIYVYYGKPDATTTSDGDATFDFFDDFLGDTLDVTKWDTVDGSPSYTISDSKITITDVDVQWNAKKGFHHSSVPSQNKFKVRLIGLEWIDAANSAYYWGVIISNTDLWIYEIADLLADGWADVTGQKWGRIHDYNYQSGKGTLPGSGNVELMITKDQDNNVIVYWDGASILGPYVSTVTLSEVLLLVNKASGLVYPTTKLDTIIWQKYVDPKPTHGAWGSEESAPWPF